MKTMEEQKEQGGAVSEAPANDNPPAKPEALRNPFTKKEITESAPQPPEPTDGIQKPNEPEAPKEPEKKAAPLEQKDRALQREKERQNELKRQKAELEKELKKAIADKDEIAQKLIEREQKLIEREQKSLERQQQKQDKEEWVALAGEYVQDIGYYKEASDFYIPRLMVRPAIEKAIKALENPHKVLNALFSYMDENNVSTSALTDENRLNDRQLARFFKQIENELNAPKPAESQTPLAAPEPKREIPKSIIPTTAGDDGVPNISPSASRKEALMRFRKYGAKGVQ